MNQLISSLPSKPGAYIFKNKDNEILYVGKAKDLKKRVASYFAKGRELDTKTIQLVAKIESIDHIIVNSEVEAFLLEANLIKKHRPFYNIKFSDDKSYPYLKITKKGIPYVSISRKRDVDRNAYYFGPFPEVLPLRIVLRLLRRIFPYQTAANHPKRRCLYNHLGLCPCVPAFPENTDDYKKNIKKIILFFEGNKNKLIKDLLSEQKTFVKTEEFEKASVVQKQINSINAITNPSFDPFSYMEKPSYYFDRIANELKFLSEILKKENQNVGDLKKIECYDISNLQGSSATASMVVFVDGDVSKKDYKRFKIKTKHTPDDFHMLQEVIRRRLKHEEWGFPDLMVIDGGKGQVSSVLKVLMESEYKIPVIGLAKREEIIIIPKINSDYSITMEEIKLPKDNPGVNLLRRIRDEAHRFAITYHRLLRSKRAIRNS